MSDSDLTTLCPLPLLDMIGLMTQGKPISCTAARYSSSVLANR